MAFENLFIRRRKSIGTIEMDAVISENTDDSITITNNPVELGAQITDHAVIEPTVINMIACVSDNPLGTAALGQIVDSVTGLFGTSNTQNLTRSQQAHRDMVRLMKTREPIQLQTNLNLYENMLLTRINVTQDVSSSRIVNFNLQFREILIVDTQVIQLTAEQLEAGNVRRQGSPPEERGRQEPKTPDDQTNRTYLKALKDFTGTSITGALGG